MGNQILELAKRVLAETGVHNVLESAMDHLIQLSGAERGMVILFDQDESVLFETARNLKKEDIENPEFEVSQTIILPFGPFTIYHQAKSFFKRQSGISRVLGLLAKSFGHGAEFQFVQFRNGHLI